MLSKMLAALSAPVPAVATVCAALGAVVDHPHAPPPREPPVAEAAAVLRDASGRTVGAVRLAQGRDGRVAIEVQVAGLSVGLHGIHLHAVGACDASGAAPFASAGGHVNPHGASHGLHNPRGAHAGDLPNLDVGADGTGRLSATTGRVTLAPAPASLLDDDGAAVVVHAGPDDQVSDPAGNSGARVACGVLQRR
jgi:Cu-Zn family superoxide dismutase